MRGVGILLSACLFFAGLGGSIAAAETCDDALFASATSIRDPRMQVALAQILTEEAFVRVRSQNGSVQLLERTISSFVNFQQFQIGDLRFLSATFLTTDLTVRGLQFSVV
jgi:hypothetical protein